MNYNFEIHKYDDKPDEILNFVLMNIQDKNFESL
jgi:hypothetical protein